MVCEGRSLDDMLPMIPNYYEYGSELIFHYTHDDHMHKVVSPRNNWYDQEMQVARLDYKPLVLDHENHGDPYDSMVGVQTDIQDFIAGSPIRLILIMEIAQLFPSIWTLQET